MTKTKSTNKDAHDAAESLYTVEELAAEADAVFHASPDLVTAALRMAGVCKTTPREAAKLVDAFRKKEV